MNILKEAYIEKYQNFLSPAAKSLEGYFKELLKGVDRVDNICTRAKSVERFVAKALKTDENNDKLKYSEPLEEIQDQIGARIVVFYLSDVQRISDIIKTRFAYLENSKKSPESDKEFGYFGEHFILPLPTDVTDGLHTETNRLFELQIKTLFQHAWSEAEHDTSYKAPAEMTREEKRLMALTSANAWSADQIFEQFYKSITTRSNLN